MTVRRHLGGVDRSTRQAGPSDFDFRVTHVNGSTLQRCVNLHRYDLEVVKKDREEVEAGQRRSVEVPRLRNVAGPWPPSRLLE